MAKISRRTANKRGIQRTVVSSVDINHQTLGERLEARLFPDGVPEDLTMSQVTRALAGVLAEDYRRFEEADQHLARETSEDRQWRVRRDRSIDEVRQCLIGCRSFIDGLWGREACDHLGLVGETPESPDRLLSYARNVERKLNQGLNGFDTQLRIAPVDIGELAEDLSDKCDQLEVALEALQLDIRETEDARNRRDEVAGDWNRDYVPVATIIEQFFRLADMSDHADRVRPTSRRRSGLAEEEDLELIEDDPDIDIVDEEPVEDPSETDGDIQEELDEDVVTS